MKLKKKFLIYLGSNFFVKFHTLINISQWTSTNKSTNYYWSLSHSYLIFFIFRSLHWKKITEESAKLQLIYTLIRKRYKTFIFIVNFFQINQVLNMNIIYIYILYLLLKFFLKNFISFIYSYLRRFHFSFLKIKLILMNFSFYITIDFFLLLLFLTHAKEIIKK